MDQIIQLTGARVALDADCAEKIDLRIRRSRILPFDSKAAPAREYDLSGYLLLPGLINAHDHLQFGLYPRLGRGPWRNSREWASEVHRPDSSPVKEHRAVPKRVRLLWGAIRNLLSGVTTVAHHDPAEATTARRDFPIRVVRRLGWAHSLDFSPDIIDRHRSTRPGWPFVVHAAEGTDERAAEEIDQLEELGVLDERTLLVHATGATGGQLDLVRRRGASVIWCPSSNLFMFGRTLSVDALRSIHKASLGTDSALTANGDLADELDLVGRIAAGEGGMTTVADCYRMVTRNPASALRLCAGEGAIAAGAVADFTAVRDTGKSPGETLMNLRPELVIRGGVAFVVSERFPADREIPQARSRLHGIDVEGRGRFLVRAFIPRIYAEASKLLGSEIRLGGKRVAPFAA